MKKARYQCTLVAIAKNEGKYVAEWIAYHHSIGVDRICVYVNDSDDDTGPIVKRLAPYFPVIFVDWPSGDNASPQRAAYNNALRRFRDTTWMGFVDIDEFIVPFEYQDLPHFLNGIPADVTAVGLNTRMFGSSGVTDPNYDSVLRTFRRCSNPQFPPNRHTKVLVRPRAVLSMRIHHADMKYGRSVNSAFEPLIYSEIGKTPSAVHAEIQVNHYRLKTLAEFELRRAQGNANHNPKRRRHFTRNFSLEGFTRADRNEIEDQTLTRFFPGFERQFRKVKAALQGRPELSERLYQALTVTRRMSKKAGKAVKYLRRFRPGKA